MAKYQHVITLGKDINPAVVEYGEVQQGKATETVKKEEESIREEDSKQREKAYEASKPTLKEGLKTTGVSAAIEGGVTFCMSVARKRKEKSFSEFTEEDWKEIGVDTGKGVAKGGIRGGSIYVLTNFTATPANVASAFVTAAFGVASQIKALENGNVSQEDFIINCETVCLDVTVSTLASTAGQLLIPIPVLGAVIGNITGEFIYEICKKEGNKHSQKIIEGYHKEMEILNKRLDIKYLQAVAEIQKAFQKFKTLEEMAFDVNINKAFSGSIDLAIELGVDDRKILKNIEAIDKYFLM